MTEKELTKYDDDMEIMDIMPMMIMVMVLALIPTMISPITQYVKTQVYQGLTDERTLNVTPTTQWINLISDPPYNPWISASFFNNGPNSAFIAINNPSEPSEIASGGSLKVNMTGALRRIEFVFYRCNTAERASVSVIGKY